MKNKPDYAALIWGLLFATVFLILSLKVEPLVREVPSDASPATLEIANKLAQSVR